MFQSISKGDNNLTFSNRTKNITDSLTEENCSDRKKTGEIKTLETAKSASEILKLMMKRPKQGTSTTKCSTSNKSPNKTKLRMIRIGERANEEQNIKRSKNDHLKTTDLKLHADGEKQSTLKLPQSKTSQVNHHQGGKSPIITILRKPKPKGLTRPKLASEADIERLELRTQQTQTKLKDKRTKKYDKNSNRIDTKTLQPSSTTVFRKGLPIDTHQDSQVLLYSETFQHDPHTSFCDKGGITDPKKSVCMKELDSRKLMSIIPCNKSIDKKRLSRTKRRKQDFKTVPKNMGRRARKRKKISNENPIAILPKVIPEILQPMARTTHSPLTHTVPIFPTVTPETQQLLPHTSASPLLSDAPLNILATDMLPRINQNNVLPLSFDQLKLICHQPEPVVGQLNSIYPSTAPVIAPLSLTNYQSAPVFGQLNQINLQPVIGQLNPINHQPFTGQLNPTNFQPVNTSLNYTHVTNQWVFLKPVNVQPSYNNGLIPFTDGSLHERLNNSQIPCLSAVQHSSNNQNDNSMIFSDVTVKLEVLSPLETLSFNPDSSTVNSYQAILPEQITPIPQDNIQQVNHESVENPHSVKSEIIETTTSDVRDNTKEIMVKKEGLTPVKTVSFNPYSSTANSSQSILPEQIVAITQDDIQQVKHEPVENPHFVKSEIIETTTSDVRDNTKDSSNNMNLVVESVVSLANHSKEEVHKRKLYIHKEKFYFANKFYEILKSNGVKNGEYFTDMKLLSPSYVVLETMTSSGNRTSPCTQKCKQSVVNKLCTKIATREIKKEEKRMAQKGKLKRQIQNDLLRIKQGHFTEYTLEITVRKLLQRLIYDRIFNHFAGISHFRLPNRIQDLIEIFPKVKCDNGTHSYIVTIENEYVLINDNEIQSENLCGQLFSILKKIANKITFEGNTKPCKTSTESDYSYDSDEIEESDSSDEDDDIAVDENRQWKKTKTSPTDMQKNNKESMTLSNVPIVSTCLYKSSKTIVNDPSLSLTFGYDEKDIENTLQPSSFHSQGTQWDYFSKGDAHKPSNSNDLTEFFQIETYNSRSSSPWCNNSDLSDSRDAWSSDESARTFPYSFEINPISVGSDMTRKRFHDSQTHHSALNVQSCLN